LVNRGDAKFDAFEVLIGAIDGLECGGEDCGLPDGHALDAIRKALLPLETVGEFIGVGPGAVVDQQIDVRTISTLGVREDAERGGLKIAAMLGLMRERVATDEVHLLGLVGLGGEQGGFCHHAGLQRQQIAEHARQRDDHVDARTTQFFERDQLCTGKAVIAVKTRARTDQREHLGNLRALAFQIVGAPQHHRDGFRQMA